MKNRLKIERSIRDITQDELSKIIGVSRQTINAIEKSKYIPSTVLALKIAQYFEIKVEDLFELEAGD
jgi:putative transcriptional regulator